MLIEEQKLRRILRSEYGGLEGERFQNALDDNPQADPIPVTFGSDITNDLKVFYIPRAELEKYVEIAQQELMPEVRLLTQIKPQMRTWIKHNRKKMCEKLREALKEKNWEQRGGVTIVWPVDTPDLVDHSAVMSYLEAYE